MTLNVLADRHHADLFYSLQLLGDRLGWHVFCPVGHEWWDEGYWRFGYQYGDDRLARQFLNEADFTGFLQLTTSDPAHPGRPILGVTLEEARSIRWGYVMATVPDNQAGFARLAAEIGAKFLIQCGNTGQYIDWSLDPFVLNSSEMPLQGRGLMYHQEIDTRVFRWQEPRYHYGIASFVNCMPSMGECWELLRRYRADLQDRENGLHFEFLVCGIDGPDGNKKPIQKIAEYMALSGFGWHDKAHGDGFGHVIHQWAAIGRPIIGHARHYAGKMAGPLWEDGVTAIDLDARDFEGNVKLIRDIANDPERHLAMCKAIRQRFDELVDYEAEAQRIREALA